MIYTDSQFKEEQCNLCGETKPCFVQEIADQKRIICPHCLSMVYCY